MNDVQPVYELASGGSVVVVSENGGRANLYIWFPRVAPSAAARVLQLQRSVPMRVTFPELAPGSKWKFRLDNALTFK
jgi:hypothetical protein